ncbi:MAG: hypothetical protein QF412_07665 [Planctomycetota bacterium]|jgi:hypothetical protein|nr:hypothetical protein [Planctomycetota bacterium]
MKALHFSVGIGFAAVASFLASCEGGKAGDRDNRGDFQVNLMTTGLGQVFPYRIREVDPFGNPTTDIVSIETIETLKANVNANNGVLPVASFASTAILPSGGPGNHFLLIRFSNKVDLESVLSDKLANQTNSGLTTAISLLTYDPNTEATAVISGRGFVNGETYYNEGGTLVRVKAVEADDAGDVSVIDSRAAGFPRGFSGDEDLVTTKSFVFVADTDDDLTTFETFPTGALLRFIVTNAVRNTEGKVLTSEVYTATTVGVDPNPADVMGFSPTKTLQITPGNGESGVDPTTSLLVRFNKPVQPLDVGSFYDSSNLLPKSGGMTLSVTLGPSTFSMLYYADPLSVGDLCNYVIRPGYNMPGLSKIVVTANNTSIRGLAGANIANTVTTDFTTGTGPGIANAPVAPEAIYVGIGGSEPGVAVIDMNGFGQGTGDNSIPGITERFTANPNLGQPGIFPVLAPGKSNMDAGSPGVMRLVKDSSGETKLLKSPLVGQVTDMHLGCPLDMVFNNENINVNSHRLSQQNPAGAIIVGNTITVAPHPNPPKLTFPPPNPGRAIFGEEPTVASGMPAACATQGGAAVNMLVAGNPFATKGSSGLGIFGNFLEKVFYGPAPPPASPPPPTTQCPFYIRQQIGHFLYVLDGDNKQVLVVNSNRFTVIDTIKMTDPVDMAISPNLRVMAVTNGASSTVTFVDINPFSLNFHKIIAQTNVPHGPTQIAFQPDGEDALVVCPYSNSLTVIRTSDFAVRKTVTGFLNRPMGLGVTPRFATTGNTSSVYYAYILNETGTIAMYESGPQGVNGIGFEDIIGTVPGESFRRARRVVYDPTSALGAILVPHVDSNGLGVVSRLELSSSPQGPQSTNQNNGGFIVPPTFRQKEWTTTFRYGGTNPSTPVKDLLTGNSPVDVAFDEMINIGGAPDQVTPYNSNVALPPMGHSGKGMVKGSLPPFTPKFLFIAMADTGNVDIIDLATGKKYPPVSVPGVASVVSYWRQ